MYNRKLREYLQDELLGVIIKNKKHCENIRDTLNGAIEILHGIGISEIAIKEIQDIYNRYEGICEKGKKCLEHVWEITPEEERIIRKYIDCDVDDIDDLPGFVSD